MDSVFQSWDSSVQWHTSPTQNIKHLYTTIYAFNERHNTSATINTNTNEILRTAHTDYITNSPDLSKETFFVEVLSRLVPTLTASDVELWLKTYLRPALDSAGFDIVYVSKTRHLLKCLTTEMLHTSDLALRLRRERIANMTMDHVMRVYIGTDPKAYDMIQLSASDADMATQVFAERRRFIERNATTVLLDWGLQDPKSFFLLLNPYFSELKSRLKTLVLASGLVSKNVSATQTVVETPFYLNLLRCLCLDSSESILKGALTVLMMLFGKICDKMALHLPELLIIVSRLEAWNCGVSQTLFNSGSDAGWCVAGPEKVPSVFRGQIYPDRKFDLSYLITLVYGLFPKSLISFADDPNLFLSQNPPSCLKKESPEFLKKDLAQFVSKAIKMCLQRCMIHPNFLHGVNDKTERKNPIEWILKKNTNTEIGEAEVLFECLSLNPEIMITISDDYVLPEKLVTKIRSSEYLHGILSSRKASIRSLDSPVEPRSALRGMSSSSILDHPFGTEKRTSPSQKKIFPDAYSGGSEGIEFKPFTFDGSSSISQSILSEKDKSGICSKDDLSMLFSEHERLYTSAAPVAATSAEDSEDISGSGTMSRRSSEKNEEQFKNTPSMGGNVLEFYQRELLLIKNELEFAIYVKSLYRLRYVKLKLKLNSMSESMNKQPEEVVREEGLSGEKNKIMELSKGLLEEKDQKLRLKAEENNVFVEKLAQMHTKLQALEVTLGESKAEVVEKAENLEKSAKSLLSKDEEIINLKNKITFLQGQSKSVPPKCEHGPPAEAPFSISYNERDFLHLKNEIKMFQHQKLTAESELEHVQRTLEFCEKDFESQMAKTKLEMRAIFAEQAKQYEKKIKELSAVLLKYETALQEERVRAAQLSKAIPIRASEYTQSFSPGPGPGLNSGLNSGINSGLISGLNSGPSGSGLSGSVSTQYGNWPSNYRMGANEANAEYPGPGPGLGERTVKRGSHASVESSSSSSVPSTHTPVYASKQNGYILPRQASSTSMPIVKGRGGYQKRSKKVM